MRKFYLFLLLLLTYQVHAQTTLTTGDIAFTGYNSDDPDEFSFVILRTGGILSGTQIRFTDNGWKSGTCGTDNFTTNNGATETEILWTAIAALSYGTQIRITGLTATTGTVTGTALLLSEPVGDQILAFQGTRSSHTMLAGIHMNYDNGFTTATNWDDWAPTMVPPEGSNRPPCLVNGTHALYIFNSSTLQEVDNARLKLTVRLTGNPATDRAAINNRANWDLDDVNRFTLPPGITFLPVKFTYIKIRDTRNAIEWGVAEESNVKDYTIQSSTDGIVFSDVADVAATGSSEVLPNVRTGRLLI